MPYVEGETLKERLASAKAQLSVDEALRLAREVAEALAYAHTPRHHPPRHQAGATSC